MNIALIEPLGIKEENILKFKNLVESLNHTFTYYNTKPKDEDDLRELCSSYCEDTNDVNGTNEFLACQLLNLLQCYGSQFVRLILLLIFLYAWNNQMTNNYLMKQLKI